MMKCNICGADGGHRVITAKEMMFGLRDQHTYFLCCNCGCLQIMGAPVSMEKYYPGNYYAHGHCGKSGVVGEFMRRMNTRINLYGGIVAEGLPGALRRLPIRAMKRLKVTSTTRILDVGCGSGGLLRSLANIGLKNLLGVDPYIEKDIHYGRGLRILKRVLSDVYGEWDVIMFHHSLEHVTDQKAAMLEVGRLLAPGGTCLIRTPTVSSYAWRHYGAEWVQLDAPRHFFVHSTKSMGVLASTVGLSVIATVYDSTAFQFWGSELYRQGIPLVGSEGDAIKTRNRYFAKDDLRRYAVEAKKLNACNDGDQAVFYLARCVHEE